jgi:S1-C subfamily serine protease
VFFVKQRFEFGAFIRDLNDAERQELQTNRGAAIRLVIDESPAFNADILVGDIVTLINDIPITNAQHLATLLQERKGQPVSLSLIRRGQRIEKSVQLNP